jgi:hypothetical protein
MNSIMNSNNYKKIAEITLLLVTLLEQIFTVLFSRKGYSILYDSFVYK